MSIASEISRLQSSKADVKTQVNIDKDLINNGTAFIGSETLDDYDDCIKNMQEAYKKFIPIQSESGNGEVTLDNSGDTKAITNVEIYGNATQSGTPTPTSPLPINVITGEQTITINGKNKFDKSVTPTNVYDTTYSVLDNGVRAILGSAGTTNRYMTIPIPHAEKLLGKTLTFYSEITPSASNTGTVRLFWTDSTNKEKTKIGNNLTATGSIQWTIDASFPTDCYGLALVFSSNATGTSGQVGDYVDYTNAQLEVGSTKTSYEPYGSTDYTIDLDSMELAKTGTFVDGIKRGIGKNLFNYNVETYSGYPVGTVGSTISFNSSVNSTTYKKCCYLEANKTYTLSWVYLSGSSKSTGVRDLDITNDENVIIQKFSYSNANSAIKYTFTPTESGWLYACVDTYATQLQLEINATSTYFEPYGFKNIWYTHNEVGKTILNGTEEDWSAFSVNYEYQLKTERKAITDTEGLFFENLISSHFVSTTATSTGMANHSFSYFSSGGNRYFRIRYNEITSLDDFKTWLSSNNVTMYYPLAISTDVEITDSTLISQLEAMHLKTGINNISIDTTTGLQINYIGEANPHL